MKQMRVVERYEKGDWVIYRIPGEIFGGKWGFLKEHPQNEKFYTKYKKRENADRELECLKERKSI